MAQNISPRAAQQIVETVRDVCGRDVNYIDLNGMIYASTDPSRIGKFHEIGKQASLTGETIEVADDGSFYGTRAGVNIPMIYNGDIIAVIGISGPPDEVRKYAYLAQKITLLLLKEQELGYQDNNKKTRTNYVIRSLIDEDKAESRNISDYMKENGIDESGLYRLVLVRLNDRFHSGNLGMVENMVLTAFQAMHSGLYTFIFPNEYILIAKSLDLEHHDYALERLAEKNQKILRVAVSDAHPLYEQHKAYREAQAAAKAPCRRLISAYGELGLEILGPGIDEGTKCLYKEKFLGKLSAEDLSLLAVYYEEDMSLARTGSRLFLHKNTIQYQLNRIYKKSGFNPRNFRDAAGFYAALAIQDAAGFYAALAIWDAAGFYAALAIQDAAGFQPQENLDGDLLGGQPPQGGGLHRIWYSIQLRRATISLRYYPRSGEPMP